MNDSYTKLDQALKDLVEAYAEMEEQVEGKFTNDEDACSLAVVEALAGAIESAVEENDVDMSFMANMLSALTDALEDLDPTAFEDEGDGDLYDIDLSYELDDDDDIDIDDD